MLTKHSQHREAPIASLYARAVNQTGQVVWAIPANQANAKTALTDAINRATVTAGDNLVVISVAIVPQEHVTAQPVEAAPKPVPPNKFIGHCCQVTPRLTVVYYGRDVDVSHIEGVKPGDMVPITKIVTNLHTATPIEVTEQ